MGSLPGDQTASRAAVTSSGGYLVWQDNATDGAGLGIGARRLNSSFSGDLNVFRVNQIGAGDQENPQVALLSGGGAAFVWQGGAQGFQKIYARFVNSSGTFVSSDVLVNTFTNNFQTLPAVAALNNGNAAVVWQSFGQDGSLLGIYGQLLSATGAKIGSEFRVNQTTNLNQRTPSVLGLANGNFVVAWVTEAQAHFDTNEVSSATNVAGAHVTSIYGRVFNQGGTPVGNEFALSAQALLCANPALAGLSDGGFVATWSQRDPIVVSNSWDVFFRAFSANGAPRVTGSRVNTTTYGEQYAPKVAASGTNCFVIWTSYNQDGAVEGVYGQYLDLDGNPIGGEIRVNTTTRGAQLQPSLAADDTGRYLAVWSSFVGGMASFDLFAQRYGSGVSVDTLVAPSAPYVSGLSQSALSITWPEMAGYSVAFYELYMDGSASPIVVNGIHASVANLSAGSTHTFRLLYQLTDGRRSPLSSSSSGTTWGADVNGDGLPDDWQALQWGSNSSNWPGANVDSDGDGASNYAEFLAATDPKDATSVLRTRLTRSVQGVTLAWNTQPGFVYQVQRATSLGAWQDYGAPRFAHGIADSVTIPGFSQTAFYRVICLR